MDKKRQADIKKELIEGKYTPKRKLLENIVKLACGKVSDAMMKRMEECSTYLAMIANEDKSKKKVVRANSCGNRFCPICNWKKAQKDGLQVAIMMQAIQEELGYEFIFLTLTTPNAKADALEDEIKLLNKSFNRLNQTKDFKNAVVGYVRKLEVTYNHERDDYNPHFHVLIAVQKSYFNNARKYISQERWLELWRNATGKTGIDENGKDEIVALNVQKVKQQSKAFLEIAKYSAKDTDLITSQEVFDALYMALKGKRLMVYGGVFKEYLAKYKNGDLNDYKELDTNKYVYFIRARWNASTKKYDEQYEMLTDDLKASYGIKDNAKVDEIELD